MEHNKPVTCGAVKSDISDFVSYLQENRTPLACDQFRENCLTQSINSVKDLNDTPLESGVYVVGAADQRGIRHCFVLEVHEDTKKRSLHDELDEDDDTVYTTMDPPVHVCSPGRGDRKNPAPAWRPWPSKKNADAKKRFGFYWSFFAKVAFSTDFHFYTFPIVALRR
jgi:hypothetical protein